MNKVLFLVRGLPGSGKSTFAKSIDGSHIEADMYFLDENGNYNFDVTKLRNAHEWCREKTETAMKRGADKVIISNTFTQEWEMDEYFKLAEKYGFKVMSIIVENRHGNPSVHNVPEETLDKMKARFQIKL
jgi:predicted kinase